ncbi:hypothetical protein KOI35_35070 [Actinoplanes bogorensis]|uniref:NACHT N-terminal Helical domain-containing protein n=1 Tax=Paractinoplanes bogorensis TaxID=1610840 RepID=A0ABS5Z2V2_9ACTN|nr:hypothetical protein [Actinoplanes bogorensis]MBU2668745.1 hypothetical protein [Actinoplanes bogorensis]
MLRPSSRRGLTYADAVHLLGAGDSPYITALGRIAGLPTAAVATATLSSVDLLAVRNEIVDWGQTVTRGLRERVTGLNRFDRTERLAAAHAVLVVSSFFEALGDAADEITLAEQVAIATSTAVESDRRAVVHVLVEADVPMPSATQPVEALRVELEAYYETLMIGALDFLKGLEQAAPVFPGKSSLMRAAMRRYDIGYRALAVDVPEFAIWAAMTDAAAGRATTERVGAELAGRVAGVDSQLAGIESQVAGLSTGLGGIRSLLAGLTGRADACRTDLSDQYRRELSRPIVDAGDLPDGIRLPATADLYVNPRARARRAETGSPVAAESWWEDAVEVADVQPFLAGFLTSPDATAAPLVVLGQPGSGKSMLTRVLAATLPPEEFFPVRVELRSVSADAPIQDQIEAAVHAAIGERVSWPELARSAVGALPVVMLDGFDELLQASGANRADYLEQVRDFQRREADRGRPVAVLVTSRIVVADRARVPDDSVVLRLDPFDDAQIGTWLDVWGATNSSIEPLTLDVALRYRELAEQPLLLLMLAIYDAWDNALRSAGSLDRADLYERLFADFARRELAKREPAAPIDAAAIAREIRRLEFVAMALFARGAQVVTERELDLDLHELLRDDRVDKPDSDRPLSAAQLLVGRFFFLHESRAREGVDQPERSFEFLHATFGEFLVARLVVNTLTDLAEERAHQAKRPYPSPVDAGPLAAWLSFAVLSARGPIIDFGRTMLSRLPAELHAGCDALLRELLAAAACPPQTWSLGGYQPIRRSASEREAAFSANLVTLLVLLAPEGVDVGSLGVTWRSQALLWESRLPEDAWKSLWTALRVTWRTDRRDGTITREDMSRVSLWHSMPWAPVLESPDEKWGSTELFHDVSVPLASVAGGWLKEAAFREDTRMALVLAHSVAPFWRSIATPFGGIHDASTYGSNLEVLLELLLASREEGEASRLVDLYVAALYTFRNVPAGDAVVMRMLMDDAHRVDPSVVLQVLENDDRTPQPMTSAQPPYWIRRAKASAGILAVCYQRKCSRPRLVDIFSVIDSDTWGLIDRPFRELLREEFTAIGVPFPESLFPEEPSPERVFR